METKVYNREGKEAGTITVPESVFGLRWNADLVHQVVTSMQGNARTNVAHTKTRGEVSGGGKKPWRQKGTGQARHGSIRSPLWRGGGITFGPRNDRDYSRKINQKMKTKALFTILSAKLRDGEIVFVNDLGLATPKTKDAAGALAKLGSSFKAIDYKTGKRALVLTATKDDAVIKSFRNIGGAHVEEIRNIDPVSALTYKYLIIAQPEKATEILAARAGTRQKEDTKPAQVKVAPKARATTKKPSKTTKK